MSALRRKSFRSNTKVEVLFGKLRTMALQRGPNAKMPSTQELCATLGTTSATLNIALNELDAHGVIVRKTGVGIFVSPRIHHKSIALVLGSSYFHSSNISPFWNDLWRLFVKEAGDRALSKQEETSVHLTRSSAEHGELVQENLKEQIISGRIQGVLGIGLSWHDKELLTQNRIPCSSFAGEHNGWQVAIDACAMHDTGVRALRDRGCESLALWFPAHVSPSNEGNPTYVPNFFAGSVVSEFKTAMARYGLAVNDSLIRGNVDIPPEDNKIHPSSQQQGYQFAKEIFGTPRSTKPQGIYINDDMMTFGAMIALTELGVEVGRDVIIATHANAGSPILSLFEHKLDLIEIDPANIVRAMFDQLDRQLGTHTETEDLIHIPPRLKRAAIAA